MMEDGFSDDLWLALAESACSTINPSSSPFLATGKLPRNFLEHQERLRVRSKNRFRNPERWLWTSTLLEQASDQRSSELMASLFPKEATVIDICCGAGADAVALARRGPIIAIDQSKVAAALTSANLALNERNGRVLARQATVTPDIVENWVHIDPDRRSHGKRTTGVEFFEPPPQFLAEAIKQSVGGSIKVAPATRFEDFQSFCEDNQLAVHYEKTGLQFVSWGGSVRQQRWWWNVDAIPSQKKTVSVWSSSSDWAHWTCDLESTRSDEGLLIDEITELRGFIGDTDPGIRAARAQQQLAAELEASIIGNPFGYFHSDQSTVPDSPFVTWFQIEETIGLDRKKLRHMLHSKRVGTLEIKTRNIDIEIDLLRKELKLSGEESRSLLITRCGKRVVAILAKRLPTTNQS
jgi:THUMP domain-like/Methyltransferase small domain